MGAQSSLPAPKAVLDTVISPSSNPKILHRIYFDDMPPFRDPFDRFLASWVREMPGYRIMRWNASNVDLDANDWVRRAAKARSPVFLSEYYRWKVLSQFGGVYLDADCEVLDGARFHAIVEDVFASTRHHTAVGVEDFAAGHPTAQTVIAKLGSPLVAFMVRMYDETLSSSLWHWREMRGLIGPQLMSLYFMEHGFLQDKGMFPRLEFAQTAAGVKIYPQEYFSPKFSIDGKTLRHTENTCIYHLFANLNMVWTDTVKQQLRETPALFAEYKKLLNPLKVLHRIYFGFDGKPDSCAGYLDTWKTQLPEYQIRHWNADNLPMDVNEYVRDLHAAKDHAFLTDYFRWWVLREHGGIYLDADVEVVDGASFNILLEELQETNDFDAMIGIDNKNSGWYTAHSMISKPNSGLATFMCRVYEEMGPIRNWRKKAFYLWAPQLTALYFFSNGHHRDGMGTSPHLDYPEVVSRVKIYPQDYFSPIVPETQADGEMFVVNGSTQRTVLCHHFACSWHDDGSPYSARSQGFGNAGNVLLRDIMALQGNKVKSSNFPSLQVTHDAKTTEPPHDYTAIRNLAANQVWIASAQAQRQLGRLDDAEDSCRRALSIDDRDAVTHLLLGQILREKGHKREAAARFRFAIQLDPENKNAVREVALLSETQ